MIVYATCDARREPYFAGMEDENAPEPATLAAIAQKLGELAAHLRDLAQEPLAAVRVTDLPGEAANLIVPPEAAEVQAGSS